MTRARIQPHVLLVEGKEEVRTLPELLELAGIPWPNDDHPVTIRELEGIQNIIADGAIEAEFKASGLKALGVIVDADGNPDDRWRRIASRLTQIIPDFPEFIDQRGVIHVSESWPRVGVWIMPDNVRQGMLETMLLELRTIEDPLQQHISEVLARARELGAPFREVHRPKAELHTWLAWQDPPGLQIHMAVKARLLNPTNPVTGAFVGWFRRLFAL